MIDLITYAIGFIIYMTFNIITFEVYSKKQETTNRYILFLIYMYYSAIISYVIYLMDYNQIIQNNMEIIVQSMLYMILGGFVLYFMYQKVITLNDKNNNSDEEEDMFG